ncbi:MAG: hypothetical protein DI547_00415 [Sphingobium sp.]|jgi:hypothetical protein|nr:MAG: hypothetical protein DI547_00415 [Sphingobium sp.]
MIDTEIPSIAPVRPTPSRDRCGRGRHVARSSIRVDDQGIEHSRCRHCGCELTRMPVLRRWYRTGMMG